MIIITYVSGHSSRVFHRFIEGDTKQEMDKRIKVFSSDWGEVSRMLVPKSQVSEYLYKIGKDMLGGIYHIETDTEVIAALKVMEVVSTGGEVYITGEDEEGFEKHIAASKIHFYWSRA